MIRRFLSCRIDEVLEAFEPFKKVVRLEGHVNVIRSYREQFEWLVPMVVDLCSTTPSSEQIYYNPTKMETELGEIDSLLGEAQAALEEAAALIDLELTRETRKVGLSSKPRDKKGADRWLGHMSVDLQSMADDLAHIEAELQSGDGSDSERDAWQLIRQAIGCLEDVVRMCLKFRFY